MIPVTKPFLPPIEEYQKYAEGIWQRNWVTNNGPLVNELELKLKVYLNTPDLIYATNGTIAMQIAIKALDLKGEIITTPFSYVATTSCIIWEGCEPVFTDIDMVTLNIDPAKIEKAITEKTSAILVTHVFGNPCDIEAIEKIAKKHNLKIIYDAAHCFGTQYKGKSVFNYGDISTTSFHATKLFHTTEGGAIFTQDANLLKKMSFLHNFGHNGPVDFAEVGINGKNSEFHAAMGLVNLKYIDEILEKRKSNYLYYLNKLCGTNLQFQEINSEGTSNYSYMPVVFPSEEILLKVIKALNSAEIFPRRYFYPSLNTVSLFKSEQNCPISESIAPRILCLPLYHTLGKNEIDIIVNIILKTL